MTDPVPQRLRIRAAARIREALVSVSTIETVELIPWALWQQLRDAHRRMHVAQHRGWQHAFTIAQEDTRGCAATLYFQLQGLIKQLDARRYRRDVQSLAEIYRDLVALDDEFEDVQLDLPEHKLSVVTKAIELEEVYLGPFKIVLDWCPKDRIPKYEVRALEPQPATGDSKVTHPHVNDNQLCEGEGQAPITRALDEGRLYDFFMLVQQVLESYNSASAYVKLESWIGERCADCGYTADDTISCERCNTNICCECSRSCCECSQSCCEGCLTSCTECGDRYCEECLKNDLCENCEELEDNTDETDERALSKDAPTYESAAEVAVHAVCVGETCVPA